ncbi:hypothetical protein ACIPY6_28865 [Streptomyces sp. NPDC090054]|uniref:hypothetical protein n=1 Tax=Streptomyces sp. NPDC090054 TaxID=3365933 RepID=UPI0037FAA03C
MSSDSASETPEQIAAYLALGRLAADWNGDIYSWAHDYRENLRRKYPDATPEAIYDGRKAVEEFRLLFVAAMDAVEAADDAAGA